MSNVSDNDKSKILNLYALFGVTVVLTLIPHPAAGAASLLMAVLLILTAYKMRGSKEGKQSFIQNHAAYILRTIAGVTLLLLVTMSLASFYVLDVIDYGPFEPCAANFRAMGPEAMQRATHEQIYQLASPCMYDFLLANQNGLIVGMLIASVLPLLYVGYRFLSGIRIAYRAAFIDNPQKWV